MVTFANYLREPFEDMQVYRDTDALPEFKKAVVTIGTFDGVHTGHRQIIAQLNEEAAKIGGESVIITFHPHPRRIVTDGSKSVFLLNTIEEKAALLAEAGIDNLVICPFTETFSRLSASEYITEFLLKHFKPHTIVIGYDHRFGQGRSGDYKLLEKYSKQHGFGLKEIPAHVISENTVSSTNIRKALLSGNVEEANSLLGYNFFFEGTVMEGNKLGRTIGYPTANLDITNTEKLVPGNGVYAVDVTIEDHKGELPVVAGTHKGMMNIGVRPTIDNSARRTIEVNIFDFDQDIYGRKMIVTVKKFLREEQKFNGLDALKAQLQKDKEDAA